MSNQPLATKPTPQTLEATKEERVISFVPFGAIDTIKLSVRMIQDFIARPTRSGKKCTPDQALRFLMLCQAQRLNPWQGDCFCIGYDTAAGPEFSNVTAHQAFLKRAEANENYDGMTSGLIVRNKEGGPVEEIEGDFYLDEQEVLGGWAKVIRKDRKIPFYRRIRMARFYKDQSQWKVDAAGMICKCAEADALRSAFPTVLGGLYMPEEMQTARDQTPALNLARPIFSLPAPAAAAGAAPEPPTEAEAPQEHPQEEESQTSSPPTNGPTMATDAAKSKLVKQLLVLCNLENISVAEILAWLQATDQTDGSQGSLDEVPLDTLTKVIAGWAGDKKTQKPGIKDAIKAARSGGAE